MTGGDLSDLLQAGTDQRLADFNEVPTTCKACPDTSTHAQQVVAGHAEDADDLRGLLQMLGLVDSPPPSVGRDAFGESITPSRRNRRVG